MVFEQLDMSRDCIAPLFDSLGTERFGADLFQFVCQRTALAGCTAFFFPSVGAPVLICEEFGERGELARAVTREYLGGFFSRDANFLSLNDALDGRHTAIRCMHRDAIKDPSYRSKFYDDIDIQEKFSFLARGSLGTIYINMYRAVADGAFQPEELTALGHMSRVCISAVRKHFALLPPEIVRAQSQGDRLRVIQRLLMNQRFRLTQREAQICAHVVLGYSTCAIAGILGLTENTVGTFRKRAYARLNITSQSELFAICLEAVDRSAHIATQ